MMCFRYLNSGLRFLVTLVLILALAFFTCGVFIVLCRKCDDQVCTTIKFLTRASKISLPQTKGNLSPPDKEHGTVSNVAAPGRELPPGSHRNQVCRLQLKSAESRVGRISSVRRILEK